METEIERAKKSIKDYRKSYGQNQLSTDCIIQLMIEHSRTEQLILPVVGKSVKEKHTLTFDEWLQDVKGFDLNNTESYIKELSLNFHKYNLKYKKWLEHQP